MAGILRPAGPYQPYEIEFVNGRRTGTRQVWAQSWRQARALILDWPSCFGLTENIRVLRVTQLHVREQSILVLDERIHSERAA